MDIDFNNARRQAGCALNRLVATLNNHINGTGCIIVDPEEIRDCIGDLRMMVGSIMCTYEEGNEKFKDMYGDPKLIEFMPEEE